MKMVRFGGRPKFPTFEEFEAECIRYHNMKKETPEREMKESDGPLKR